MGTEQIVILVAGALAAGLVNGLTGFGTALTAVGIWIYVITPTIASTLAIICSVVSQTQTMHLIWRHIDWKRVAVFVLPGVLGVPIGTFILPHIDPRLFKLGTGAFLIVYPSYVLMRKTTVATAWGGKIADGITGFGGGILGGLGGFSGVLPIVWTDFRGWTKHERRSVIQFFNMAILSLALVTHAATGLVTRQVLYDAAMALPATIAGAWIGAWLYRRLGDHGYQRAVMALLLISGVGLIWTSW